MSDFELEDEPGTVIRPGQCARCGGVLDSEDGPVCLSCIADTDRWLGQNAQKD